MRYIIILLLLAIVGSLFVALVFLYRHRDESGGRQVAKFLTIRVALSWLVFLLLMVSYAMGWITDKL